MLHPSYQEMIDRIKETAGEEDQQISSRYSLVIAAAKRARQINAGSEPLVNIKSKEKNLSIAVDEFYAGKIHILEENEEDEAEDTLVEELPEEAEAVVETADDEEA